MNPKTKKKHNESKRRRSKTINREKLKETRNRNEKTNKGELIFYGKSCLHGSVREKLKLFRRYCEEKGKGNMKKDAIEKKNKNKRRIVKAKRNKNTMQINNGEERKMNL